MSEKKIFYKINTEDCLIKRDFIIELKDKCNRDKLNQIMTDEALISLNIIRKNNYYVFGKSIETKYLPSDIMFLNILLGNSEAGGEYKVLDYCLEILSSKETIPVYYLLSFIVFKLVAAKIKILYQKEGEEYFK